MVDKARATTCKEDRELAIVHGIALSAMDNGELSILFTGGALALSTIGNG
jgi:hypothetical protein